MRVRELLNQLGDPNSVAHGVVSTVATTGLALIDPRRLSVGGRLAYRSAAAVLGAWTTWAGLRPTGGVDPLGRVGRVAGAVGAAGAVMGVAEASEAVDARLHDSLVRAGATRPRLWLAGGQAALSVLAWWGGRAADRRSEAEAEAEALHRDEHVEILVPLPEDLRYVIERVLSSTEDHSAAALRTQVPAVRVAEPSDDDDFWPHESLITDLDVARVVPASSTFPVLGRFRALGDRTFDVRLGIDDGRLSGLWVQEGGDWTPGERESWENDDRELSDLRTWPNAADLELFIETPEGHRPIS